MHKRSFLWVGFFVVSLVFLTSCSTYRMGNWKLAREDYEEAITHYLEDLSENPDHWQARERLGFAYLKTGRLDEAIQELERVLEQEPGDPYANYYLGLAWLNKGEHGRAIEVWESYKNREDPLLEKQIKGHVTLLKITESISIAKEALKEEERLETLPPKPGTVAVFYFRDTSADNSLRHFQKALAAMIISDLSQVKSLQVLERLRIQFLLTEMGLGQTGIVDKETAPRAGRLLGTENLIVGTMGPGSLVVTASVARTSDQAVVGGLSVGEEEEKFFELQKAIVFNVLRLLGVSLTPEEEKVLGRHHTKSFKAVIYFGQALEALDEGKWKEAKNFFQKALREDPNFMLARLGNDACPAATAPSIGDLGLMSNSQLSAVMEEAVTTAMAGPEADPGTVGESPVTPSELGAVGPAPGEPGSISVSW